LDIARSCLILPFLLDDRIVNYLIKNEEIELELEQLIKEQPRLFVSYNKRYLSLLPVTINSLILLSTINQIKIEDRIINNGIINFDGQDLGDRFNRVKQNIPKFLSMLDKYTTIQLYKILNVQL
jgi:hypothetical protein